MYRDFKYVKNASNIKTDSKKKKKSQEETDCAEWEIFEQNKITIVQHKTGTEYHKIGTVTEYSP